MMHKHLFFLILFSFIQLATAQHRVAEYNKKFVKGPLSPLTKPLPLIVKKNLTHIHAHQKKSLIPQKTIVIPLEIVEHIIISSASLNDAAQWTSLFIQTNKKMYNFFNDDKRCLRLIKILSQQFDASNALVAQTLQIKKGRERYNLQNCFLNACRKQYTDVAGQLNNHLRDGLDIDFTYDKGFTLLMHTTGYPNQNSSTARWLLKNGANLTCITHSGSHTIAYLCQSPDIFPDLLNHPDFNVHFQNKDGNTPLLFLLKYLQSWNHTPQDLERIYTGTIWLLENGADPELANNKKTTPLSLVQGLDRTRFKDLIQEAIDKKYATKK